MSPENIIKIPYTSRPYMVKNDLPIYNNNPCQAILEQKHQQLQLYDQALYGITDRARDLGLVGMVSAHLGKFPTQDIKQLALQFEEDLAILYDGILSAICFCFPSSWIPSERLGQSLQLIHSPVADGAALIKASPKIAQIISNSQQGSFKRSVWTITKVPGLSNFPSENQKFQDQHIDLDHLYFRTEHQTTYALPDNKTCVFFVKVHVEPLGLVWQTHRNLLISALDSMSDAMLIYKNLVKIKQYLKSL